MREVKGKLRTFFLEWIRRRLALGHIDYTVHVERNLLAVRRPVLIAEAVGVSAIHRRVEGVVARAHDCLMNLITS